MILQERLTLENKALNIVNKIKDLGTIFDLVTNKDVRFNYTIF